MRTTNDENWNKKQVLRSQIFLSSATLELVLNAMHDLLSGFRMMSITPALAIVINMYDNEQFRLFITRKEQLFPNSRRDTYRFYAYSTQHPVALYTLDKNFWCEGDTGRVVFPKINLCQFNVLRAAASLATKGRLTRPIDTSAWHFVLRLWPQPQPADFSGRTLAISGRTSVTVRPAVPGRHSRWLPESGRNRTERLHGRPQP